MTYWMALNSIQVYLFICFAILLASCTITNSKPKDPEFVDINRVHNELSSLVDAENIDLNGAEVRTKKMLTLDKALTSELDVRIRNGKNIPEKAADKKALGKAVAKLVRRNLKDSNQFDIYRILFVTEVVDGNVIKRFSVDYAFSSSDL